MTSLRFVTRHILGTDHRRRHGRRRRRHYYRNRPYHFSASASRLTFQLGAAFCSMLRTISTSRLIGRCLRAGRFFSRCSRSILSATDYATRWINPSHGDVSSKGPQASICATKAGCTRWLWLVYIPNRSAGCGSTKLLVGKFGSGTEPLGATRRLPLSGDSRCRRFLIGRHAYRTRALV
jgi:hypothetical protein